MHWHLCAFWWVWSRFIVERWRPICPIKLLSDLWLSFCYCSFMYYFGGFLQFLFNGWGILFWEEAHTLFTYVYCISWNLNNRLLKSRPNDLSCDHIRGPTCQLAMHIEAKFTHNYYFLPLIYNPNLLPIPQKKKAKNFFLKKKLVTNLQPTLFTDWHRISSDIVSHESISWKLNRYSLRSKFNNETIFEEN